MKGKTLFREKTINVGGQPAFYLHRPGEGETLVVLHGFPGSHLGLLPFAQAVHPRYGIVLPDFPACGQTPPLEGRHSMERYADWLADFLDQAGIARPVLVGHSFGARVALYFARRYPGKAQRYVFLMPVVRVSGWISRFVSAGYRVMRMLPQKLGAVLFSSRLYGAVSLVLSRRVFQFIAPAERDEIIRRNNRHLKELNPRIHWDLFSEFYGNDLSKLASAVNVPALVLAADRDMLALLPSVRAMADQLSRGHIIVVAGAGHLLPFEQPRRTAKEVERWLESRNSK